MENYDVDLKISYRLTKKLNIGSSYAIKTKADIPVLRIWSDKGKHVYIPGSSIKGVMRTAAIRVANLLGDYKIEYSVEPSKIKNFVKDIVVELFGGPDKKTSKIYVSGIMLSKVNTTILTHVSIDDSTRTAKEGALYRVEYIPPYTTMETWIHGRNLSIEEARLLFASILELNYERIGKSGLCSVRILRNESRVPEDLLKDPIIKIIWEGIGV